MRFAALVKIRSGLAGGLLLAAIIPTIMTSPASSADQQLEAFLVASPPTDRRNAHYVSNRAPLAPSPLVQLPIKAIKPRGWLRKQLELQAEGFHGHLGQISAF